MQRRVTLPRRHFTFLRALSLAAWSSGSVGIIIKVRQGRCWARQWSDQSAGGAGGGLGGGGGRGSSRDAGGRKQVPGGKDRKGVQHVRKYEYLRVVFVFPLLLSLHVESLCDYISEINVFFSVSCTYCSEDFSLLVVIT